MVAPGIERGGPRTLMSEGSDRHGARSRLRLVSGGPAAEADAPLVRAFLAGDDRAFGELVQRHERAVLAVVRRFAAGSRASEDVARDLAQQTFVNAFEAARRSLFLREGEPVPFRAWLMRIAVNLGRNHARQARRWRSAPAEDAHELPVEAAGSARLERGEADRAVRKAMEGLSRRQREVVSLRIDAELPFRDVAEALGITENAAKVHFHHAARRLRDAFGGGELP